MVLMRQNQGFIVEGQELPVDHPAHPIHKNGLLIKMAKKLMKKPKKKNGASSDHVLSNTMNTTKTQPSGSYAV
jgi:hypothetical protein